MLGNHASVVFEVPLEKSASPPKGHVIKRLLNTEAPAPTLEAIEQKLAKARELRELEQSKKIGEVSEERISRAQKRRSTMVDAQATKIRTALDVRMEVAVQKRSKLISDVVQKAQRETEKLGRATQSRQDTENTVKSKHQIALEKLNQSRAKKEQLSKDAVLKAKTHTDKVLAIAQSKKEKEAQAQKTRELGYEQKLQAAQTRKETITKQKVQTAQMLQTKRSPSKDCSPKKEE